MNRMEKVIELLEEALKASRTGENASFGDIHQQPVRLTTKDEVDAFVKERIKLYMGSWVTGPIAHALEILKNSHDIAQGMNDLKAALNDGRLLDIVERLAQSIDAERKLTAQGRA
jgi:hypothetical protein